MNKRIMKMTLQLMKHSLTFLLCLIALFSEGQEYLKSTKYNNQLFPLKKIKGDKPQERNLIPDRFILFRSEDSLNLPFIDDFSTDELNSNFPYENFFSDTIIVSGNCLNALGIQTESRRFMLDQSFAYSYDTMNKQIDSFPKDPVSIDVYTSSRCFESTPVQLTVYPEFYNRYVFDTLTGKVIDSVFVGPSDTIYSDTTLSVAVIYIASVSQKGLWMDHSVFINNNLPRNPPSLGVASFDGLDEFGLPYAEGNAKGSSDVLTSKPIMMAGLTNNDSVYFSFLYQAGGYGDSPDDVDSLFLEFKNERTGKWVKQWTANGGNVSDTSSFKPVKIYLKEPVLLSDPEFFYNGFQFRFRRIGSLAGNNDHWHVDYVQLDANRMEKETLLDITLFKTIPSILETYSLMPWDHFSISELIASLEVPVKNLANNSALASWDSYAHEIISTTQLSSQTGTNLSFLPGNSILKRTIEPATYNIPPLNQDRAIIRTSFNMVPTSTNLVTSNDSTYSDQVFDKTYAYDDGSAEKAYGLKGLGNKRFAYRFVFHQPDTLAAIQIHFSNVIENVENLIYNIYIWKRIGKEFEINPEDHPIYIGQNRKPIYVDSVNGFATFVLNDADSILFIEDTVFIGWSQSDEKNIEIGYDVNSEKGYDHMFIFTNGSWKRSSVSTKGSPMIRAIIDNYPGYTTSVPPVSSMDVKILLYPNPAYTYINLSHNLNEDFSVRLFDIYGRNVFTGRNVSSLDIDELSTGVYVVQVETKSGHVFNSRFNKID